MKLQLCKINQTLILSILMLVPIELQWPLKEVMQGREDYILKIISAILPHARQIVICLSSWRRQSSGMCLRMQGRVGRRNWLWLRWSENGDCVLPSTPRKLNTYFLPHIGVASIRLASSTCWPHWQMKRCQTWPDVALANRSQFTKFLVWCASPYPGSSTITSCYQGCSHL